MCVRYVGTDPRTEKVQRRLNLILGDPSLVEVFPGDVGAILGGPPEKRNLIPARWGMQPVWVNDPRWGKKNAYNARSETLFEKPTFRAAVKSRRCLVPAQEFYERAEGRWIRMLPEDGEPLLIAGLFEPVNNLSDLPTYTLVTTLPNLRIVDYNDRMPVLLTPEDAVRWLDKETPIEELPSLMIPCPEDLLRIEDAGPVGKPKATPQPPPTLF